jgi:hypothetical protein
MPFGFPPELAFSFARIPTVVAASNATVNMLIPKAA